MLSHVGDQFAQVAIAILVYGRTHSAFLTALAYALTYLPPIAGGPLLSGLADLFPCCSAGWQAFYIVPEGLAAAYARSLHGSTLTVGPLGMAAPARSADPGPAGRGGAVGA